MLSSHPSLSDPPGGSSSDEQQVSATVDPKSMRAFQEPNSTERRPHDCERPASPSHPANRSGLTTVSNSAMTAATPNRASPQLHTWKPPYLDSLPSSPVLGSTLFRPER